MKTHDLMCRTSKFVPLCVELCVNVIPSSLLCGGGEE